MACPSCGSWAVRADRSLAGRMVCGRCGQPLGGTVLPLRRRRRFGLGQRLRLGGWCWPLLLLLLGGVLAALEPVPQQGPAMSGPEEVGRP
ncbi:MAG: hypothetical protein ACK5E6_11890 [Cyanobacteriota bacterium]|jgi:hypothetical protein